MPAGQPGDHSYVVVRFPFAFGCARGGVGAGDLEYVTSTATAEIIDNLDNKHNK